jgi:hypothetical protein
MLATAAVVLVLLAVAVPTTAAAPAAVTVDRAGWWNKTQGATDPLVGNTPINGLIAVPPPPTVPADTLPVTAIGGEPQTVAAIGFAVDAPPGSTVNTFVVHLKSDPAGDQNAAGAAIAACPITDFWGEADNGKIADAPLADCSRGVKGTRADDGTWTFDLAPFASSWFDQAGTLTQNGVLLTEAVDAPGTFQVTFERPPDGVAFDVDITPGAAAADAFAVGGTDTFAGGGSVDTSVDLGAAPAPVVSAPTVSPPSTPRLPSASVVGARAAGGRGRLPLGLLALIPLALLAAALAGSSLARATPTTGATARQGGVSRALRHRTESA